MPYHINNNFFSLFKAMLWGRFPQGISSINLLFIRSNTTTLFSSPHIINALFSYKKKKEFKGFIENTTWPQGFLNYYFLNIVTYYYNDKVYSKV